MLNQKFSHKYFFQAFTVCSLFVLSSSSDLPEPSEVPEPERVRRVGTENREIVRLLFRNNPVNMVEMGQHFTRQKKRFQTHL